MSEKFGSFASFVSFFLIDETLEKEEKTKKTHTLSLSLCPSLSLSLFLSLFFFSAAAGLCPIIEPEVLLDGDHDIDRTLEVAEEIWAQTFK